MSRLVINSILYPVCFALLCYLLVRAIVALVAPPNLDEWSVFRGVMLIFVGIIAPFVLIISARAFPIERRLANDFGLRMRWPFDPTYERTVTLLCPAREFLTRFRGLIAASTRVLSVAADSVDEGELRCTVRLGIAEYHIRVLIDQSGRTASIGVRWYGGPLAYLAPFDLTGARLLAGLIKWSIDEGIIEPDIGKLSRPDLLAKDLGGWLPERGRVVPMERFESVQARVSLREIFTRSILAGFVISLTTFLLLGSLDGVPRIIQVIPLLIFAGYANVHVIRLLQGPGPKGTSGRGTR